MAIVNPRNFGFATGRLTKDPKTFENKDGSKKIIVSLAMRNLNTKNNESAFVDFTGFVPKETKVPVYDMIHEGDLVMITYDLRNNNYTLADGTKHFEVQMRISNIDILEPKSVTDARLAARENTN